MGWVLLRVFIRGLIAIGLVLVCVVAGELVVFRLPTANRHSYDVAFRQQCGSLRPGMQAGEVEAAFDPDSFPLIIERKANTVEVEHQTIACTVTVETATDLVLQIEIHEKSAGFDWAGPSSLTYTGMLIASFKGASRVWTVVDREHGEAIVINPDLFCELRIFSALTKASALPPKLLIPANNQCMTTFIRRYAPEPRLLRRFRVQPPPNFLTPLISFWYTVSKETITLFPTLPAILVP